MGMTKLRIAAALLLVAGVLGTAVGEGVAGPTVKRGGTLPLYLHPEALAEANEPRADLTRGGGFWSPGPERFYGHALRDLRDYLQQMTGAQFPLTKWDPKATAGIVAGTFEQFPDFKPRQAGSQRAAASADPEAFVIDVQGDRLFLLGKSDLGVMAGIYTLLDRLGCKWFAPGKHWENVPELGGLTLDAKLHASSAGASNGIAFSPDGRLVAAGSHRGEVRVWSAVTGRVLCRLRGHGWFSCVAFAPHGRHLVTAGADTTALLWDLARFEPEQDLPPRELTDASLERAWAELGGDAAATAYQAGWGLVSTPAQTVGFLKGRLKPVRKGEVPDASEEQLRKLVGDLDDDRFAVREAASTELGKLGTAVGPALRRALAGNPSVELRARAERLLAALERPWTLGQADELLRTVRAIRVLEQIGTREAREVLEDLAGGWPAARQTREARAALERAARQAGFQ